IISYTQMSSLSLHDALPIYRMLDEATQARERLGRHQHAVDAQLRRAPCRRPARQIGVDALALRNERRQQLDAPAAVPAGQLRGRDRKSTRLNSSHVEISYAV